MRAALDEVRATDVTTWDMHATATPGDPTEIETAQHLGMAKGKLFPMALTEGELHADVKVHSAKFVQLEGYEVTRGYCGKLSMGVGGINSCVISRPWDPVYLEQHLRRLAHAGKE